MTPFGKRHNKYFLSLMHDSNILQLLNNLRNLYLKNIYLIMLHLSTYANTKQTKIVVSDLVTNQPLTGAQVH
jgi:hypothetical protein